MRKGRGLWKGWEREKGRKECCHYTISQRNPWWSVKITQTRTSFLSTALIGTSAKSLPFTLTPSISIL